MSEVLIALWAIGKAVAVVWLAAMAIVAMFIVLIVVAGSLRAVSESPNNPKVVAKAATLSTVCTVAMSGWCVFLGMIIKGIVQ